jgi:hypothetical protein
MMDEPVVTAMSPCWRCQRVFMFNPLAVPSISTTGDPKDRQPICADCIPPINAIRERHGLPPVIVRPDAYEPLPAELLP